MCRNIRVLFNFEPQATPEEIRASSLQYVRKVSGMRDPSAANREAFEQAVDAVAATTESLLTTLVTTAEPKSREQEKAKARERWERRAARIRASG